MFEKIVKFIFGWGLWINAAVLVPQSLQLYHTKLTEGLSLPTFGFFVIMQLNGFFYGLQVRDKTMAWGWLLSCIVTTSIVVQILLYR